MRVVSESLEHFDTVYLEFLHLESELPLLLLLDGLAVHVLMKSVNVFGNSVGVLLHIAIGLEPQIIWLAEDDQVLGGVADFVVRLVFRLVLHLGCEREQESFLILLVAAH